MIVTRRWLEEFINLESVSTRKIIDTLNRIGQEVEAFKKYEIPQNVVVGKVIKCEKHPDADKLSVCKVDIGSSVRQIVCGASNVAVGQFVPVATIGAILGEDFKIKKAKLRGIESGERLIREFKKDSLSFSLSPSPNIPPVQSFNPVDLIF